jgi:hypothetical protein
MNAAQKNAPPPSTRRLVQPSLLSGVRSQAAFVRALLDEVERAVPSGCDEPVSEQLVEELARLGCRFLEAASALTAAADDSKKAAPSARRGVDESHQVRRCA